MHNNIIRATVILPLLDKSAVYLISESTQLRQGVTACPGDTLDFICETRDSNILAWSSDEYIGPSILLEFTSNDNIGSLKSIGPNTTAVLTHIDEEGTVLLITSNLSIIVLPSIDHQDHSVTCMNVRIGVQNVTTISRAGKFMYVYMYVQSNCSIIIIILM